MKKLALALSLALVFALSVSSFAAFVADIKGTVRTDITFRKEDPADPDSPFKLYAASEPYFTIALSGGSGGSGVKAFLGLSPSSWGAGTNDNGWIDWTSALTGTSDSLKVGFNSARLEATGAWWKGGPELTTILGTREASWNIYTAHKVGRNGIEISGLTLGPVNVKGYYGWPSTTNRTAAVVHANAKIDVLTLDAYLTNWGAPADSDSRVNDFTVVASATPVSGVTLNGVFSHDGEAKASAYKATAKLTTIPNLTLDGLVQFTEPKYGPEYSNPDGGKNYKEKEQIMQVSATTTQSGVTLNGTYRLDKEYEKADWSKTTLKGSAETTIEGYKVKASLESVKATDDAKAKNTTTIELGKTIANVTVNYTGKIVTDEKMENTVTANTKIDTPFADGVALNGIFKEKAGDMRYGADAQWTAPNGITVNVGYANFNWRAKDLGKDAYVNMPEDSDKPNGFFIRLYSSVSF